MNRSIRVDSRYFVVAAICTERPDVLREALSAFRDRSGLPQEYEFKFNHVTTTTLRKRVFSLLAEQDFDCWAVIADKTTLADTFRVMHGLEVYLYFVSELVRLIPGSQREQAILIPDEFGSARHTLGTAPCTQGARRTARVSPDANSAITQRTFASDSRSCCRLDRTS